MSSEIYMAAHEELVNEMLERDPDMDEDLAYTMTEGAAWDRMIDKISDMVDMADCRRREVLHETQPDHDRS